MIATVVMAEKSLNMLEIGKSVLLKEAAALLKLEQALDDAFVAACSAIHKDNNTRQLVVTGLGKSGHIARKIAATFAATAARSV